MAEHLDIPNTENRSEIYEAVLPQIKGVMTGETDLIANLANISAILNEAFGFLWVGFYIMKDGELVLGPFQGPLACTRIPLGKGVCGTVAARKETLIVPNVDEFPGHIACSSRSKSEIVVPLVQSNETKLILDIDSESPAHFTNVDKIALETVIGFIKETHF